MTLPTSKKWLKPCIIAILVIAFLVLGWRFLYFNQKNADNLPQLSNLNGNDLDELIGYKPGTLRNVWGDPDQKTDDQIIYNLDDHQSLVLTLCFGHVSDAEFIIE